MNLSPRTLGSYAATATFVGAVIACSSQVEPPAPVASPQAAGNGAGVNGGGTTAAGGTPTGPAQGAPADGNPAAGMTNDGNQSSGSASGGPGAQSTGGLVLDEPNDPLILEPDPNNDDGDEAKPLNLGTEQYCDGIDENSNGIIDDVDVGKDGLCDCINMGFFGQIASDAGSKTTAFEDWLVERSGEVPVKHLDADQPLTADWLASLQVLIVGGLQDRAAAVGSGPMFTPDEIAAFDDWLQNRGAGVFTLSGYTDDQDDARPTHELLANTGLGYVFMGIPQAGVIENTVGGPPAWLDGIVAPDHPSVEGVDEIGVFLGYPVSGNGTVILRSGMYDLAIAAEVGNGRAFVFADEWITQDVTWSGTVNGQQNPCQQPCNEEQNICGIAEQQCNDCALQPCSDPTELDAATCHKGCQGSCDNETARCMMYAQDCADCTAESDARAQQTPRLWLNTIRWLTPQNECQVEIPPIIRVR